MPTRTATAHWEGGLQRGQGSLRFGSGSFEGQYSFASRFEDGSGTNPEELIAAAHAGCFSMALTFGLEQAGYAPSSVETTAQVPIERVEGGFRIPRIQLTCTAHVPDIDEETFATLAETAKTNCPVSKALTGVDIQLAAKLAS